jgi:putative nucleotidyltransferase with HDIG domain
MKPLPGSVMRVIRAADNPNTTSQKLANLIGLDQALSAHVLQVANSAALGYVYPCSSLVDAVTRIGFDKLRILALGSAAMGTFSRELKGYRIGDGELWRHSVNVAKTALQLVSKIPVVDPEVAYVGGLLHDMGKLLLDQYILADYKVINLIMTRRNLPLWKVEEILFGLDHAGVGGFMAEKWNFSYALVQAIRFHHEPKLAETEVALAAIVNLANALAPDDLAVETELSGRSIHPDTLGILKIDERDLELYKQTFSLQQAASVEVGAIDE